MGSNTVINDVIIVGTGAAGLFCALNLPENLKVLIITKDKIERSDSFIAQGGISTLRDPKDYAAYFEDTIRAGHYKNTSESVKVMIESSPQIIKDLVNLNVDFDHTDKGFSYTREGGHSQPRILHKKDTTGEEISSKLLIAVQKRANIIIEENTIMLDIICSKNSCKGIVVQNAAKEIYPLYAKTVVLATGGIGGLFQHSTNFSNITGDAIAIAINHHIKLKDLECIQIHPTALYSKSHGRRFLISESVRGEGAILLNSKRERFVDELLPRDVVAKAIKDEMLKDGTEYVNLSLENLDSEKIKTRFPNIYKRCLEEGYDITHEYIPVIPAQHYFMGGIKVDLMGKTSMDNLFAIGETSCNGVHGHNRLGSNSLLESVVFSKRSAEYITKNITSIICDIIPIDIKLYDYENLQHQYKQLILNEIKRRDAKFYEQWFRNEN